MPTNQSADFILNGRTYMLQRASYKGRAWRRTGLPNAVRPLVTNSDAQRNALQAEVDFVAVYDDFSGGFGDAYRDPTRPARIHWSENMETRFPRQMIHCQAPQTLLGAVNTSPSGGLAFSQGVIGGYWIMPVPDTSTGAGRRPSTGGRGNLLLYNQSQLNAADVDVSSLNPTGLSASGRQFDRVLEYAQVGGNNNNMYRGALFGSFAWLPGESREFWRRSLGGVAGLSMTMGPLPGQVFVTAGNRLWRAFNNALGTDHVTRLASVAAGADPMGTANWSATLNIGNGQVDVLDMVALDDQVFLGMQDGLYAGDLSGTFVNVLGEITGQFHPDNGRHLSVHDNGVVYPYVGGLKHYRASLDTAEVRDITPDSNSLRSPLKGRFRTTHSYAGWLYGGYFTGSQSFILAGRDRGGKTFDWYPLQRLPHPSMVRQVVADGITTPSGGGSVASGNTVLPNRFWALTEWSCNNGPDLGATSHIYWWPIPPGDTNPLGATNFSANYTGSARVDFGRDSRGAPETLKVLRRVDVNTDASTFLSGSRYADVYYALDGGGRTLLGRAQQSPRTTLYFSSGEGSFVTCYDFELSTESFTFSANLTPVYRSFVLHGAFLTEGPDQIDAIVRIADNVRDRTGTPMRTGAAMISELRALGGAGPVKLIDLSGAQNWVTVQKNIGEEEVYEEGSDEPEIAAAVRMVIQNFS